MSFKITSSHLEALKACQNKIGGNASDMGTAVPNDLYEWMMNKALKIKPAKRETRFKDHLVAKSGMRTTVRYRGGFLYDDGSIVIPNMFLHAKYMQCVPISAIGVASVCMTRDSVVHCMFQAAVKENATGNHYRNHTTTVRLPHFRSAC